MDQQLNEAMKKKLEMMDFTKGKKAPVDRKYVEGIADYFKGKDKSAMMAKGGYVKSADGCAQRGKTRGRMV